MVEIGRTYPLTVVKRVEFGVYLDADNLGEILLPNRAIPENTEIGDSVDVFIYLDSEDRLIATTRRPRAQVGEFAYLTVADTNQVGAFLDWGLEKQLLVPFSEQHRPMETGKSYLVYLYVDARDDRIVASSKVDNFLREDKSNYFKIGQKVDLIIANSTELGFKAIINHKHWGVLYKNDVFQPLSFGQRVKGFIQRIRPDGKIDLTLNGGSQSFDKNTKIVLRYLNSHEGYAPFHDKSEPQAIAAAFGMSKGAFKKVIGHLFKKKIIQFEPEGIRLVESHDT
ncbi:MAG: GntR family transcriptional regulator [Cellvibrionaceae bacterium]